MQQQELERRLGSIFMEQYRVDCELPKTSKRLRISNMLILHDEIVTLLKFNSLVEVRQVQIRCTLNGIGEFEVLVEKAVGSEWKCIDYAPL